MLETKNLSFRINDKSLINDITLKFSPGLLYGILGPNGSGKSTFFKTLTKIWTPASGSVLWQGNPLHQLDRRHISRTISLVSQSFEVHFDFTVEEVVQMGRYPHSRTSSPNLLKWALSTVDAWHLRTRRLNSLSIGERQRTFIARALMTESPILLLDEPSSSLDIRHQLEIWELLQNLAKQDKIVIVATHDIQGTKRFCDRVAIFNHGECVAEGVSEEVINAQLLSHVFGVHEEKTNGQFVLSS